MKLTAKLTIFALFVAHGLPAWSSRPPIPADYLDIRVQTADFVEINGRLYDGGNDDVIIYCHSLLGNSDEKTDVLLSVFGGGYDLITFDFRGHRSSLGLCTSGGDEILDLRAMISFARLLSGVW